MVSLGLTCSRLLSPSLICDNFDSLGLTWSHLILFVLVWSHLDLDSLDPIWSHLNPLFSHLDSLGFTWSHLDSLGLTWSPFAHFAWTPPSDKREGKTSRKKRGKNKQSRGEGIDAGCELGTELCAHARTTQNNFPVVGGCLELPRGELTSLSLRYFYIYIYIYIAYTYVCNIYGPMWKSLCK